MNESFEMEIFDIETIIAHIDEVRDELRNRTIGNEDEEVVEITPSETKTLKEKLKIAIGVFEAYVGY